MQFENINNLKRILTLLKQISNDTLYINSKNALKGINFSAINPERTILLDVFIPKEEKITEDNENFNFPKKFSLKTGKLFFDLVGTVENGSNINLDYEEEKLNIKIYYDDIKLKSVLNATSDEFIGFPRTEKNMVFTVSGEKMSHTLNLLSKFKNDLIVKIENNTLIVKSKSSLGSTELLMPAKITGKKKNAYNESIYDYEIIKPLLSASKISKNIEVMFNWNKNINENVLIAKCNFKDNNGHAKYLFTPKGVLDGIS